MQPKLSRKTAILIFYLLCCHENACSVLIASNSIPEDGIVLSCLGTRPQWSLNMTQLDPGDLPDGLSLLIAPNERTITIIQSNVLAYNSSIFQCSSAGNFTDTSSVTTTVITVYGITMHIISRLKHFHLIQVHPQSQLVYHQSCHQYLVY